VNKAGEALLTLLQQEMSINQLEAVKKGRAIPQEEL
jgi:hypothetical protein